MNILLINFLTELFDKSESLIRALMIFGFLCLISSSKNRLILISNKNKLILNMLKEHILLEALKKSRFLNVSIPFALLVAGIDDNGNSLFIAFSVYFFTIFFGFSYLLKCLYQCFYEYP